jgi:SAM-dependent methyltransferase
MDSPEVAGPALEEFHRDLARIHSFLGTFPTMERCLRQDERPCRRVLDIGCGGGDLLRYLKKRLGVEPIGVDLKPGRADGIRVIRADAAVDPLPEADVAVSSLVAHHLTPEQNIAMIRNVGRSCRRFVIHDLIRHPMPLILFTVFICPLIGKVAAVDGRQSIRRSYTPQEIADLAGRALAGTSGTFSINVSRFLSRQIVDIRYRGSDK